MIAGTGASLGAGRSCSRHGPHGTPPGRRQIGHTDRKSINDL
jgi:hypothetical protein